MMKSQKDTTASKKIAAAKARKNAETQGPQLPISPGEVVRLSLRSHNEYAGYDPRLLREEGPSRPIEGIVLSIREVATGSLVALAAGDFKKYVVEVIHTRSFDPAFGSLQNAGKVSAGERAKRGPLWDKMRNTLRQMAAEHKLISLADGSLNTSPLNEMLDGWRIVKVRADQIEVAE